MRISDWSSDVCSSDLDSRAVRQRFGLSDFTGSLFIHAIRIKGHDVVNYAMDCFSDSGRQLSCTHDANAWPADPYARVQGPKPDERLARQGVVAGKSGSDSVGPGGRRILKKKTR